MKRYLLIIAALVWMAGFYLIFLGSAGSISAQTIFGPLWVLLPITIALVWRTIEFFLGIREGYREGERSYRSQTGRCAECGYSLRGNLSQVCPECGMPVPTNCTQAAGASR